MTRIIKFRGRSLADRTWVFGDLLHSASGHLAIWPTSPNHVGGMVEIDETTVGQFTGLKDVTGAEIYEGDVIRQEYTANVTGEDYAWTEVGCHIGVCVIRSRGVCMQPCVRFVNDDASSSPNKQISGTRAKIIGNYHDDDTLVIDAMIKAGMSYSRKRTI